MGLRSTGFGDGGEFDEIGDGSHELLSPPKIKMEGDGVSVFRCELSWNMIGNMQAADGVGVHFGEKFTIVGKLGENFLTGGSETLQGMKKNTVEHEKAEDDEGSGV